MSQNFLAAIPWVPWFPFVPFVPFVPFSPILHSAIRIQTIRPLSPIHPNPFFILHSKLCTYMNDPQHLLQPEAPSSAGATIQKVVTRKGKVAHLPKEVRDRINQMMSDGF